MNKQQIITRMEQILETADKEKRDLTEPEDVEYNGLEVKLHQIELAEKQPRKVIKLSATHRADGKFEGEFAQRGVVGGLCDSAKYFFQRAGTGDRADHAAICRGSNSESKHGTE